MGSKEDKSKYQVPNLDRALRIMEFLADNPSNATKAEIARELKFSNNSVYRIVSTLEENGYIIRNEESNEYTLSRKLLSLGYKALVEKNLVELAGHILRALRDETRETALLGGLLEGEGVVLEQELSPEPIKFMVSPGTRFLLHTAAPAKAILAYLDQSSLTHQLHLIQFKRLTDRTICNQGDFLEELKNVKELGFAIDNEEEAKGVVCIGAPVFDYRGIPKAAIWVTGPKYRINDKRIQEISSAVKIHSTQLSKLLGYEV